MNKKTQTALQRLAVKTAKGIYRRRRVPGWREDESRFPQTDFENIQRMLEESYQMGFEAG